MQIKNTIYVIALAAAVVIAQKPGTPSPCPNVQELAASMAESRVAAERLKIATSEEALTRMKSELGRKDSQLAVAQTTSEKLTSGIELLESERTRLRGQLTLVIAERDKLQGKIDNANHRKFCKLLHIGCIGER